MALVSMRELLDHAAANGYGIPAFNVNNLEQVQAIMEAAKETGAPVIMQASAGARKYAGEGFLKLLIQAAVESYPEIPVVMHQDHGQSPDVCQGAINLGFSSVMMDGSLEADGKTIASYEYNIEVTQKVVSMAHKLGITVEGELGCLGSLETMQGDKEDGHGTDAVMTREQLLTDPEQAADFVKRTQLDALAIAIGTSHAPTNSHASLPVIFWPLTAFKPSTSAFPTHIWSCTDLPACPKICWPSFVNTAAT
jgi:fructose-bisphosphate aldolase, class II